MKLIYLYCALSLVACAGPGSRDASFCLHGFSEDDSFKIQEALSEWNDADNNNLHIGTQDCDVQVTYQGQATSEVAGIESPDNENIKLWSGSTPDLIRVYMLHEVGHYLGNSGEHLASTNAVMHWEYTNQDHLTSDDLEYVHSFR